MENLPVWGKGKAAVDLMLSLPVPQEARFVDGRAILQWDIIASNGVLHIISEPLKAPPTAAVSAQAPDKEPKTPKSNMHSPEVHEPENPQVQHASPEPRSPPASLLIQRER